MMKTRTRGIVAGLAALALVGPQPAGGAPWTAASVPPNYYDQSWSPDGSRYVESVHGNLTVFFFWGGIDRVLMADERPPSWLSPAWSPEGSLIAWWKPSGMGFPGELWVIHPDGTGARRVAIASVPGFAWLSDGRLLYRSSPVAANTLLDVATGATSTAGHDRYASPSPDGRRIAAHGEDDLAVTGVDGGDRHVLWSTRGQDVLVFGRPSWSPDGGRVAFTALPPAGAQRATRPWRDVYLARVDGTGVDRLTGPRDSGVRSTASAEAPVWWPDGSRISFLRYPSLRYVMNADGTCEQPESPTTRSGSPWRPGATGGAPLECVDLGYFHATQWDERAGVAMPLTYRLHLENDGTRPATQALLVVDPSAGRAAPVSVPGTCSGGTPLVCRLTIPARSVSRPVVSVLSGAPGRVETTITLTSPEQTLRPVQVVSGVSDVVRCTVEGTAGHDVLAGTPGRDRICGRQGDDRIAARAEDDWIDAGAGNDVVFAGPGRDVVLAGAGNDLVHARDGRRDVIRCGPGRDVVDADRVDSVARDCERVRRR